MGYITVLCLLAACFHLCLSDELCPDANLIAPCRCDGEGINCMKVKSDSELQKVFAAFPRPWKVRGLWIQTTDVTTLPSGMFQGIEVQAFYIEGNKIRNIEKGAFKGSENSCSIFSVFANELTDIDWDELKKLPGLSIFNAGRNRITSIPEKAFVGLEGLMQIILAQNLISYIGPNAFNELPILTNLELYNNRITVLGPYALAMSNMIPFLAVGLMNCSVTTIAPTAFEGAAIKELNLAYNNLEYLDESVFSPLVTTMSEIEGHIQLYGNPLTCVGCTYQWLVRDKEALLDLLVSFQCTDNRDLSALSLENIDCMTP